MFSLSHLPYAFHDLSSRQLVGMYVALNSAIWISCTAISVNVIHVALRYQRKIALVRTSAVFGLFALACGSSHLIAVIFLSRSNRWLAADFKIEIALASITTAAGLLLLGPRVGAMMAKARHSHLNERQSLMTSDWSGDSLYILQSVYDETGILVDFRFIFPSDKDASPSSSHHRDLAGKLLFENRPISRSDWLWEKCRTVVKTGRIFTEDVTISADDLNASWLRYRVVKFNDGVAISTTNIGNNLSTTRNLAFNKAFTISSPFAIVAVDLDGIITEMNPAAERMLWYDKEELVGKLNLLVFHDPQEIARRAAELSQEFGSYVNSGMAVFKVIADHGLTDDAEWTYVRKDGSRLSVQLIVSALTDETGNMLGLLSVAHDVTEQKRVAEHISHIAHHDALTGLPTRTLLHDRLHVALTRARRNQSSVALLMVDLDNFKRINDTIGHHAGDAVLVSIANRLRASLRRSDTVARMGGDEFVVMLEDLHSVEEAECITQKLLDAIGQPVTINV